MTRDEQILSLKHLVEYLASRMLLYARNKEHYRDLVSAGWVGAIEAVDRFDETKGAQLSTYAYQNIHGRMQDHFRTLDLAKRSHRKFLKQLSLVRQNFAGEFRREATDQECADIMGLPFVKWQELASTSPKWVTMEYAKLKPCIKASRNFTIFLARDQIEDLIKSSNLSDRHVACLRFYYWEEVTMKQIGARLGMVESRVSQVITESIKKMKEQHLKANA